MSTVKVQGNASGTGSITLASPNTNSNRTINLPDVDGSFVTADASGNVGIGVTPSSSSLKMLQGTATTNITTQGDGGLYLSSNAYYNGGWLYAATGTNSAAYYVQYQGAHVWNTAGNTASHTAGNAITFTQAMTLDASGNLLVGTTASGYQNANSVSLQVGSGNGVVVAQHATGATSGTKYAVFSYGGGEIGSISQNGTTAVAYNTTSDYRLKENVQPLTGALSRVAALKPCTYTWKAAPEEIGEGFIAHELAEVCPQAVTGEKDAVETYTDEEGNDQTRPVYQGIDTSFLVATLTAAIQEQQAMIEEMKAEIAALKGATQ